MSQAERKGKTATCHWPERLMDRASTGTECLRMALGAGERLMAEAVLTCGTPRAGHPIRTLLVALGFAFAISTSSSAQPVPKEEQEKVARESAIVIRDFVVRGQFSAEAVNRAFDVTVHPKLTVKTIPHETMVFHSDQEKPPFSGKCYGRTITLPNGQNYPMGGIRYRQTPNVQGERSVEIEVQYAVPDSTMSDMFSHPVWERQDILISKETILAIGQVVERRQIKYVSRASRIVVETYSYRYEDGVCHFILARQLSSTN